jgi:hypothetical protein
MKSLYGKQSLVWGSLLILFGVMSLLGQFVSLSLWIWVGVLAASGLVVFVVYLTDRAAWGLLLTAYVLLAVSGLIAFAELDILPDPFVAVYTLTAIALPFLVVFLRDRSRWWALIPCYVLLAIGIMVALIELQVLGDLLIPVYVLLAIAIPFFVVYARDPKQWWPLIPSGILTIIAVSFLLATEAVRYVGAVVLIGAGTVILVLQLVRRR